MPFAFWSAETEVLLREAIKERESPFLTTYREGELDLGLVVLATTFGLVFDLVETVSSLALDFVRETTSVVLVGFGFCLAATSTSVVRTGFVELLTISTGFESERGTALEGGCSFEAMAGTSSETDGEFRLPHFEGVSAQAST